jgi:prepilin-type N-terminal cleavage/methylation domain-containing protein
MKHSFMKTQCARRQVTSDEKNRACPRHSSLVNRHAFTLIELLVVIAVMALIAAMIFPVTGSIKRRQYLSTASAELEQIKTALDNYKNQYGVYPPANPSNPVLNPLYYELTGVTNVAANYRTLDNAATIAVTTYNNTFNVGGAINCAKPGGDAEAAKATSFLPSLKPNRIGTTAAGINVLITSMRGPDAAYMPLNVPDVNPFRYAYPGTNNPNAYDLWIDLRISGKTNRICNWKNTPFTL